jgi:hypothetical protein
MTHLVDMEWANNGWLRPHRTSPKEIQDLLAIVNRVNRIYARTPRKCAHLDAAKPPGIAQVAVS